MTGPVDAFAGRALQRAPGGGRRGRVEAVAGEQDGVGEEAGELLQVGGAAVREVGVRLGGDADGHGGGRHQLGVGGLFAGEDDDGPAVGEEQVEPVLPGAQTAEEAYDDQVDAVEQSGEVVEGEPGRVGVAVGHRAARGTGAEQVGVGRRQEQDHAASAFLGVSAPRAVSDGGSSWLTRPLGPGSQWRDRAGFAPGFLPCRRRGDGGPDGPPRSIVRGTGQRATRTAGVTVGMLAAMSSASPLIDPRPQRSHGTVATPARARCGCTRRTTGRWPASGSPAGC